jgi:hypothetical protein
MLVERPSPKVFKSAEASSEAEVHAQADAQFSQQLTAVGGYRMAVRATPEPVITRSHSYSVDSEPSSTVSLEELRAILNGQSACTLETGSGVRQDYFIHLEAGYGASADVSVDAEAVAAVGGSPRPAREAVSPETPLVRRESAQPASPKPQTGLQRLRGKLGRAWSGVRAAFGQLFRKAGGRAHLTGA